MKLERRKGRISPIKSHKKLKLKHRHRNIAGRRIAHMLTAMEYAFSAEEIARRNGLLQRLDPRVKLVGLMALIVAATLSRKLSVIVAIFAAGALLAALSHVPMKTLLKRGWIGALIFSGLIAAPAVFITPGDIAYRLPPLGTPVTWAGLKSAAFLIARAETAVTLSLLLALCTEWAHALKALRAIGVPASLVVILGMTRRYIFLLLGAARDLLEARQSRSVGVMPPSDERRHVSATIGVLLGKSLQLSDEVHLAMLSRGFRGEVRTMDEFVMRPRDWIALAAFAAAALGAIWMGK
jgi:cobalt ECF transporter T component CbiQ